MIVHTKDQDLYIDITEHVESNRTVYTIHTTRFVKPNKKEPSPEDSYRYLLKPNKKNSPEALYRYNRCKKNCPDTAGTDLDNGSDRRQPTAEPARIPRDL